MYLCSKIYVSRKTKIICNLHGGVVLYFYLRTIYLYPQENVILVHSKLISLKFNQIYSKNINNDVYLI